MFCKHKWELISETTTISKYQHAMRVAKDSGTTIIKLPGQLCDADRKHIQIVSCSKCGKLNRFIENI